MRILHIVDAHFPIEPTSGLNYNRLDMLENRLRQALRLSKDMFNKESFATVGLDLITQLAGHQHQAVLDGQ